ncbi:hypothetical protein, partial [Pseudomonas aeruginosa]|uniref:hypothetical protein n=1 Tax=Pseudomonas aeruginosa TaxID=287 RepID=UPI0029C095BA
WLFRARHAFCVRPTPAALPFGIPPAVKLLATAKVLKTHLEAIWLAQQIGLVLVHRLALQGVLTSRLALGGGPASEIGVSPYLHAGHSLGSAFRFVRRRSGLRVGRLSGLSDRRSP